MYSVVDRLLLVLQAALDHFTRLVALELAPKGVRVNTVSPGLTVSSLLQKKNDLEVQTLLTLRSRRRILEKGALGV